MSKRDERLNLRWLGIQQELNIRKVSPHVELSFFCQIFTRFGPDSRLTKDNAIFVRAGFRITRNWINPTGYPKTHDSDPMLPRGSRSSRAFQSEPLRKGGRLPLLLTSGFSDNRWVCTATPVHMLGRGRQFQRKTSLKILTHQARATHVNRRRQPKRRGMVRGLGIGTRGYFPEGLKSSSSAAEICVEERQWILALSE